jgi:UDP-glucose 4-epimerase
VKILVTGGAGFIGSHAAHRLAELGHEVVVLDNLYSGYRWAIPEKARFIEAHVGNTELVSRILREEKVEAVLHFAAHIEVQESTENPAKYYRNNTLSSLGLFEACVQEGVGRLIFSSTAAVYGEPTSTDPLTEKSALNPMNPYGASKLMSERMLADLAAASGGRLRYVVLRYFNAAGARPDVKIGQATPRSTHLIKIAAEVAVGKRDAMKVFGTDYATPDGTALRDYIHVEDLVSAHIDALEYLGRGGSSDIFNVGYGRASSVKQVLEAMRKVTGHSIPAAEAARRPGDPSIVLSDSSKIRNILGWKPQYDDLEVICRHAFEWEKKMKALNLSKDNSK